MSFYQHSADARFIEHCCAFPIKNIDFFLGKVKPKEFCKTYFTSVCHGGFVNIVRRNISAVYLWTAVDLFLLPLKKKNLLDSVKTAITHEIPAKYLFI